jgi:ligand-binding sensor domain-containing protein
MMRAGAALFTLLCLAQSALARPLVFTDQDDVRACLPLGDGGLLLGTTGGLVHTGVGPEREWTALDGLPDTRVHALLREGDRVWIGTDRGLALMELSGMKVRTVAASAPVRAITRHRGALYLGTWGGGLQRLVGSRLVPLDADRLPDSPRGRARQRITALGSDGQALLVGTAGAGLWRLAGDKLLTHPADPRLPSPFIWSLSFAREPGGEALLVGTLAGLARVEGADVELLSSLDARALARDRGGRLLVGTYGAGLGHLAPRPARVAPLQRWSALPAFVNAVSSTAGATCVGTRDGAWVSTAQTPPRRVGRPGPPSNDISALLVDGDRLYVGTFDGGLGYLEGGRWRRLGGVDSRVDALALQRKGNDATLWVGTPRGLYRVRDEGAAIRRFGTADGLRHRHIHSLAPLRDGSLLVGTGLGAAIVAGEQVSPITVKQGLPVASVWAAAEDPRGDLWLGTSRGLYHWSRGLGRYTRYTVSSGHLGDDWVTALTVRQGAVFAGTYNAGVSRLTRSADGSFAATQLGGGWVNFNGLQVVGRTLYAASMSGLQRLALADPAARFELVAGAAPGRDVTAVVTAADGSLWVGSRRGLARHAP